MCKRIIVFFPFLQQILPKTFFFVQNRQFLYRDLSGINSLEHTILNSFSSQSEEVKSAASYTLGNIAVGNLPEYLPFILQEIESQPKRQYLLLHSLKEVMRVMFVSRNRGFR